MQVTEKIPWGINVISEQNSYEMYSKIWKDGLDSSMLSKLLKELKSSIEKGNKSPAILINYGALLLDLNRSKEALKWLTKHKLNFREYYENLAIAHLKSEKENIEKFRQLNSKANNFPSCKYAFTAYVDFHGF